MQRLFASLLSFTLLFSFFSPALTVSAQDDELITVKPISGRYEFTIPAEWIFDTNPATFADADDIFLPSEMVWVASDAETMERAQASEFDIFEEELDGVFMLSLLVPNFVAGELGFGEEMGSLADFADLLAESFLSETENDFEVDDLELRGISGKSYRVADAKGEWWLVTLLDTNDNLLLWIGYTPNEFISTMQTSLESLIFHDFTTEELYDADNLIMTAEIVPAYATLSVPEGWWYSHSGIEGSPIFISEMTVGMNGSIDEAMVSNLDNGSIMFMSMTLERSSIPDEAYDADGKLDWEKLILSQINEAKNITIEDWDAPAGFVGTQFSLEFEERGMTIHAQGVILDADSDLYAVFAFTSVNSAEEHASLITDILNTLQRVEKS